VQEEEEPNNESEDEREDIQFAHFAKTTGASAASLSSYD
jgi:hypothetical protein